MSIKIYITDDHPLAIAGIRNLLEPFSHLKVTRHFETGEALLEKLTQATLPDILLLDILLPGISGKELVPILLERFPGLKIIALTSLNAPGYIKSMMRAGCRGYLLKNTRQKELVKAIETVHGGGTYIGEALKSQLYENLTAFKEKRASDPELKKVILTRREKEILQLIVKEYNNQEIAERLFLSIRTVENHRYKLYQKLDTKNAMGLLNTAIELGLI